MKIPKSVEILGLKYEVKISNDLSRDLKGYLDKKENPENLLGFCLNDILTIFISSKIPRELQESTFIHEVLEAFNYQLALNLVHDNIIRLESAIYQFLVKNKVT